MQFVLGTYLQRFGSWRLYRHRGNWRKVEKKQRIDQGLTFKGLQTQEILESVIFN